MKTSYYIIIIIAHAMFVIINKCVLYKVIGMFFIRYY